MDSADQCMPTCLKHTHNIHILCLQTVFNDMSVYTLLCHCFILSHIFLILLVVASM